MPAPWIERLQTKWNVKSVGQVIVILIVFACTGTTVLLVKQPITEWLFPDGEKATWFTIMYWILIFPIYNMFLLAYGFLFGQFDFFWNYEKRAFGRLGKLFRRPAHHA